MKKISLITILLIAICVHSYGQILYTKFLPSKSVSYNDNLSGLKLDINEDSIVDFIFRYLGGPSGPCCANGPVTHSYRILIGINDTGGRIIKNLNGGIIFNNLDSIDYNLDSISYSGDNYGYGVVSSSETCDMAGCSNISYFGLDEAISGKYFVVKFLIKSNYHYGWIKFSKTDGVNMKILSVAYNTKANESFSINDPDPTTNINSSTFDDQISIFPIPLKNEMNVGIKDINLKRLYLTDIFGHIVISQKIESELSVVRTEKLSNGVYILILDADNYRITKLIIK